MWHAIICMAVNNARFRVSTQLNLSVLSAIICGILLGISLIMLVRYPGVDLVQEISTPHTSIDTDYVGWRLPTSATCVALCLKTFCLSYSVSVVGITKPPLKSK